MFKAKLLKPGLHQKLFDVFMLNHIKMKTLLSSLHKIFKYENSKFKKARPDSTYNLFGKFQNSQLEIFHELEVFGIITTTEVCPKNFVISYVFVSAQEMKNTLNTKCP